MLRESAIQASANTDFMVKAAAGPSALLRRDSGPRGFASSRPHTRGALPARHGETNRTDDIGQGPQLAPLRGPAGSRSAPTNVVWAAVWDFRQDSSASVYCTECGTALPLGALYCTRCGTPATGDGTITLADATYALAGFGRRISGHLIDSTLLMGPLVAWLFVLAISRRGDCPAPPCTDRNLDWLRDPWFAVLSQLVPMAYWAIWDSVGTSPGRRVVGIRIVTERGSAPGLRRGAVRALVSTLASGKLLFLGYLWVLWDRERRTWHDHAAKTWAVRR